MQQVEGAWRASRTRDTERRPFFPPSPSKKGTFQQGEGIAGCCSVLSSVLRMQRSLTEVWSDLSDDTQSQGRTCASESFQGLLGKEDDETHDNRAAYQRFFVSVVDSTDKLDRLLASLDTPSRANDEPRRSRRTSDNDEDMLDSEHTDHTVQFNTKEEAAERQELTKTLRQLGGGLESDTGVINLRAVAFWCLAKRERLWAEDEKLTRAEQASLRSIRAMEVNHEEVDTLLGGRRKRIEDNMTFMHQKIDDKSKGWSQILLGVKDDVSRSRLHSLKRTRDIMSATEGRIAALRAELAESEHHVVGLSNESAEFQRAKGTYARKEELLQHLVDQQRARLEQISVELQRIKAEASSLDDSLSNICKLESAAEGGGKIAVPFKEQNEGREKLQALVREEARRHKEEQVQAITKRAGLLEENKRLRDEVEKAESALRLSETPTEALNSRVLGHQNELKDLKKRVKDASAKLVQTERQISQATSRKIKRGGSGAQTADPPGSAPKTLDKQNSSTPDKEGSQVDPKAWYHLEMLRAQHDVLVEDLERCDRAAEGADEDNPLRERSLLAAACWQLRDNEASHDAGDDPRGRDSDAVQELAAVAVAADMTLKPSGLARIILETLDWEGQAQPLEDKIVANASRARWMYVLRLAVELGQIERGEWQETQQLLDGPAGPLENLESLFSAREGVHAVLCASSGGGGREAHQRGVFSRPTEARGDLACMIESGQARLAKLNTLLRALWAHSTGTEGVSFAERASALNEVVGVAIGEIGLHPRLAARLLSALGNEVVLGTRSTPAGAAASQTLARDVASLRLTSKEALDERSKRAAVAATKLAAALRIAEALDGRGQDGVVLSAELARRGAELQGQLQRQVRAYSNPADRGQHSTETLGVAEDFVAQLPPDASEHGPGDGRLDLMVYLLSLVTGGSRPPDGIFKADITWEEGIGDTVALNLPGGKEPAKGSVVAAAGDDRSPVERKPKKTFAGFRATRPEKSSRKLDGGESLKEILAKIARAMPRSLDQDLANAWNAAQARITRPRGDTEMEAEAFELAVDAQVLETLQDVLEAVAAPSLTPTTAQANSSGPEQASSFPIGSQAQWADCLQLSGPEVEHDDEIEKLERQAEALRYKNAMHVAARTGLPLPAPGKIVNSSMAALVGTRKLAQKWKAVALNDGSGLGRQELERLNSLLDKRIATLSAQLNKLNKISQAEKTAARLMASRAAAPDEMVLSGESWAAREVQRLNSRIRVHREQLHEMETRLKDLRKGKGGMREMETLWMSQAAREEMEANLSAISRKIAKANFLLRTMRSRWDLFREKHRDLALAVQARLSQGHAWTKNGEKANAAGEQPCSVPTAAKPRESTSPPDTARGPESGGNQENSQPLHKPQAAATKEVAVVSNQNQVRIQQFAPLGRE